MAKGQWTAGLEDPCGHEHFSCVRSLGLVETRKARHLRQLALLEHRQRPSELPGMLRQPTESETHRAAHRPFADSLDVARSLSSRSDPSFAQCLDELAHQQRQPSCCAQTRIDEHRIRCLTQPPLQKPADGCSRQRRWADHLGGWIGRERREQFGVGATLSWAGRQYDRDVQLFETGEQKGEVAQRGSVCPVRVVDDQAKRAHGGQIRAQPIEAVEDGERGIDARRGRRLGRRARKSEQSGCNTGTGLQQVAALRIRCVGKRWLEELTDNSESEIAL
jgi:hypothetical protein